MSGPPSHLSGLLKLPEAIEHLVDHFGYTDERACDLLERAIRVGSLKNITTIYPDGTEFPTNIPAWLEIDWDTGYVTLDPSYAGSPVEPLPIIPFIEREELDGCFNIGAHRSGTINRRRGGRPPQYEWDEIWVEECRRVHEDGLPRTRKKFVDGMQRWFADNGDEAVDPRTIEKKLSKLFTVLRVGFESHDARASRRTRSMTEAA